MEKPIGITVDELKAHLKDIAEAFGGAEVRVYGSEVLSGATYAVCLTIVSKKPWVMNEK